MFLRSGVRSWGIYTGNMDVIDSGSVRLARKGAIKRRPTLDIVSNVVFTDLTQRLLSNVTSRRYDNWLNVMMSQHCDHILYNKYRYMCFSEKDEKDMIGCRWPRFWRCYHFIHCGKQFLRPRSHLRFFLPDANGRRKWLFEPNCKFYPKEKRVEKLANVNRP